MEGVKRIPEPVSLSVSKVVYGGKTLVDLTADDVTADCVKSGVMFHRADGYRMSGSLYVPKVEARTIDLDMSSGNQTIKANSDKVMSSVTIAKPATMVPENIKKDVNIGGVVGTYAGSGGGGGSGETTSLQVMVTSGYIERAIFCLWQTSDGWMGTGNFDTSSNFTIPNVIVGGYVIFTRDPMEELYFICDSFNGVEDISVDVMDSQWDIPDAAIVIKVTALSPSFRIGLTNK